MKQFTNAVSAAADGAVHYTIMQNGAVLYDDVTLTQCNEWLSAGTPWTAACANALLALDDEGAPYLHLDGGDY